MFHLFLNEITNINRKMKSIIVNELIYPQKNLQSYSVRNAIWFVCGLLIAPRRIKNLQKVRRVEKILLETTK